jgi:hypothetical protein
MALATFNQAALPPLDEVVRFVRRLTVRAATIARTDRRVQPRRQIVMPVSAIALDEQLRRSGEAFTVISRDMSTRGLAFYHVRPIPVGSRLGIELKSQDGETLQTVVEVIRCQIDRGSYYIGGKFTATV